MAPEFSSPQRRRALIVCLAVTALTVLDVTKANVALPSIEAALGASSTELQLIISGYVLAFGLALVPAGRLGDQRSRRLLFIVGLSIFTAMSLLCALAPTSEALLVARFAQGVGAGIQSPQVLGLLQTIFRGPERAKAFGAFGVTVGIAMAIGPTLGGLAIVIGGPQDGWRGIFFMNVPLGLTILALAVWALPRLPRGAPAALDMDPVGLSLLGVAVLGLMWPFLFTTGSPDDDPARWWVLLVSGAAVLALARWERRYAAAGRRPILPPGLLRTPSYRNGIALGTAYFAANPCLLLLTSLYLQQGTGLAPVFAGMVSISFALMNAVAAWLGSRVVNRIGRPLVVVGLTIVLLGATLLVLGVFLTPAPVTPWVLVGAMAVTGAGGGLVMSPNQTLTLAAVPTEQAGLAGSVGQLGQRIGGSIGTAVALAFFYSTVYRESGAVVTADRAVYQHSYLIGMLAAAAFVAVALAIGIADVRTRRRRL
ncbi:MFS transporter [Herbiconiux daphne]|uniref:MFS transporter n=1 Tax=Herbiconiux daphne TaxID=2970914 RepID=A0ABT2H3J6_9MICO|nr:MFS transporter [Herbiconiux daphne]MCS5734505.1 MFS transporter [Herbiconiux daphne]